MRRVLLLFLLGLFIAANAFAQPNEAKKTVVADNKTKSEKDPEAERILRERRENAQSLLISLAADAGNYNDQKLRARTLARVADALWDVDPDRARSMFRKAWDAAEVVDDENRRQLQEEIKQQQAKRGSAAVAGRANIRNEVLRLAARRDRKLGEELLAKLTVEKKEEAENLAGKLRGSLDAPEAVSQRLNLARQLLEFDVERALQFADPALISINRDSVDFLSFLREKDAAAADQRYAALLARATSDLQSDANTVSLLTSYLFTPHAFVNFDPQGGTTSQSSRNSTPPADVSPELRQAFFRAASEILLRPLAQPGEDTTSAGVMGKYLMIKRLMPLFEQYAPKEIADSVRAHMDALANAVSEEARQRDDDSIREGIRPPVKDEDREKGLLDRIERAKTAEERDRLYLQLARLYGDAGDLRARDVLEKISDSELRKSARAYIDVTMIMRAIDKKNSDLTLELVRTGELTHLQKAWALIQVAKLVSKTDSEKALSLLDQADAEARRIEPSDGDRPRALMGIAATYLSIDRRKAWDAATDATKAANSAESFSGEDGVLRISLLTKGMSSIRSTSAREFDVAPLFSDLAGEDYTRTVELARLFEREAPRASATIAIARAVLEEKKK